MKLNILCLILSLTAVSSTTVSSSATLSSTTASSTKVTSTTAVSPVSTTQCAPTVPSSFPYSCDSNGEISIEMTYIGSAHIKIVEPSNCTCTTSDKHYVFSGCKKNTIFIERCSLSNVSTRIQQQSNKGQITNEDVIILLEAVKDGWIVGGNSLREFRLYCKDGPYTVNVTLNATFLVAAPVSYTALPSVTPPMGASKLTMAIYEKGSSLTLSASAVVGQEMLLKITGSSANKIAPVQCYASHSSLTYMFWSNSGCAVDPTLVDNSWESVGSTNSVSIALFAFHFEGSNDIDIMCTVQVCPPSYDDSCTLTCPAPTPSPNSVKVKRRKRRKISIDKSVEVVNVRTKLHVFDTSLLASQSNGLHASLILMLISAAISKINY